MSVAELAVIASIAERGRAHPARYLRAPKGRGAAAYQLYRRGYLQRLRFKSRGGTVQRYRIAPLLIAGAAGDGNGRAAVAAVPPCQAPTCPAPTCQAIGCGAEIEAPALMCGRHWALVGAETRRTIERQTPADHAWGHALSPDRAAALRPLIRLADAAILHVARAEAKRGPVL